MDHDGDRERASGLPVLMVTAEEAALMLRLSRRTIYLLIASGELASVKVGRNRRVPVDVLREYVAELSGRAEGRVEGVA
jgi:excisionase family DNA binding protein